MPTAVAMLAEIARRELTPRKRLSVSEWADAYRRIAIGETLGAWRTDRTPYLRRIMDAFGHPRVRKITICKGSQTGGTEAIINMLFWAVDRSPGLTMFVYPDLHSGKDQQAERMEPTIRQTPAIAARLSQQKKDNARHRLRFDSMSVIYRGTVNEHHLESFPARNVFIDEVDRCHPRTLHLAAQRTKTYPDGKLVAVGKPSLAGVGIDAAYEASDQRVFLVPCPHCLVYHERTFSRVRWPGLIDATPSEETRDVSGAIVEEVRARAWFKCPRCGGRCGAEDNHWQLRLGVWCPKGHSVSAAYKVSESEYLPGQLSPPDNGAEHEGYHIPEWISGMLSNPYGEAAAAFVARRGEIDGDWVTDHGGRGWKITGGSVEIKALRKSIDADRAHGLAYLMGSVPAGVLALVAAVDVQEAGCWIGVYGYTERGAQRYLIWHGYVPTPHVHDGQSLAAIDDLLYRREWKTPDGRRMAIAARCIDTGARTDEVYAYIRSRKAICGVRGVGVAGSRTQRMDQPYHWRKVDVGPDGKRADAGATVLRINSPYWKRAVMRRLGLVAGEADAEASMGFDDAAAPDQADDSARHSWHMPTDTPTEYLDQLTAEHYIRRMVRGRVQQGWEMREGRRHNHAFDCACYAEALAEALGVGKLTRAFGLIGADEQAHTTQAASTQAPAARPAAKQPEPRGPRFGGTPNLRAQRERR